jgi:hypothetical protein
MNISQNIDSQTGISPLSRGRTSVNSLLVDGALNSPQPNESVAHSDVFYTLLGLPRVREFRKLSPYRESLSGTSFN